MDRRNFIKSMAASTAALRTLTSQNAGATFTASRLGLIPVAAATVDGHTKLCSFVRKGETWTVYEDLRVRDGAITFVSAVGTARILSKTAEATFAGC
jgi:hypothetical protein